MSENLSPEQFIYWLRGIGAVNSSELSPESWKIVLETLSKVQVSRDFSKLYPIPSPSIPSPPIFNPNIFGPPIY